MRFTLLLLVLIGLLHTPLTAQRRGRSRSIPVSQRLAASDSVQTLLANGQINTVSFGQPELIGKFFDKVGNCDMELYANGYGVIIYKTGEHQGKRQEIKWGLRLEPTGKRHQFIDEDGVETHEFLIQHFRGVEVHPFLVGNYSPSVLSREKTPVIILYDQEWYLERIK